jgi:hypothetical protein
VVVLVNVVLVVDGVRSRDDGRDMMDFKDRARREMRNKLRAIVVEVYLDALKNSSLPIV